MSFDRLTLLSRAETTLAAPPALDRIVRPVAIGDRVARFVLPLEMCKPQNRKGKIAGWAAVKDRKVVAQAMAVQVRPWGSPLRGRPQVLCVRFSNVEPDPYSDWAKVAVDVLCAPTKRCTDRLNIIVDDAPRHAQVVQWWEPEKRGDGFVYIEVWTGKAEA
jgi:hypothetical protein